MIRSLRLNIKKKIRTIDEIDVNINNSFPDIKNFLSGSNHKLKVTTIYINIENYQILIEKLNEKDQLKFINLYTESILKILDYYQINNYHLFGTEIYAFIDHYSINNFQEGNLLTAAIEINSFLDNFPFKIKYKIIISTGIDLFSIIEAKRRKRLIAIVNGTIFRAREIFENTPKTNLIYLNQTYEKNNNRWLQEIVKWPCSYPKEIENKINDQKIYELNCVFSDWKIKNLNKKG